MPAREAGYPQQNFSGYSTDDKPLTGVADGSTYHVIDTGEEYVFYEGMWESDFREQHNERTYL